MLKSTKGFNVFLDFIAARKCAMNEQNGQNSGWDGKQAKDSMENKILGKGCSKGGENPGWWREVNMFQVPKSLA